MLIKELKEAIKDLDDDTDIIIEKNMSEDRTLVFGIIRHRVIKKGSVQGRLILINDADVL